MENQKCKCEGTLIYDGRVIPGTPDYYPFTCQSCNSSTHFTLRKILEIRKEKKKELIA